MWCMGLGLGVAVGLLGVVCVGMSLGVAGFTGEWGQCEGPATVCDVRARYSVSGVRSVCGVRQAE